MDLLTKAEFEAGFGSHTPMFSGQTKCVRYYMNFERALRLMKEVIAQEGHTFDANNKPGRCPCLLSWFFCVCFCVVIVAFPFCLSQVASARWLEPCQVETPPGQVGCAMPYNAPCQGGERGGGGGCHTSHAL